MVEERLAHILPMDLAVVLTSQAPEFKSETAASRDLGLRDATFGVFTARRARVGEDGAIRHIASNADAWFTFVYVIKGQVTLRVDGELITLNAHDAISQAPLTAQTVSALSPDFEFLEVQALDCERTRAILPQRPRRAVSLDAPELHIKGIGPRSFFDYRNLGVAEATGQQIEVQVIRAQRAKEGGTGWHSHNMAQLSYGLSGWVMLDVEGVAGQVRQEPGDALSIPSYWRHNAGSFSDDYWALQLQVPARYDTTVREAPEPAAVPS